ncbi:YicC/YloC family endoribonuclease [Clostridium drakei]|uniref:YicC family protein n=1 Tax=Clostridium drakei TaxID=332101 RepID=A0A2U8DNY3_9CLOT|nr:YicC/YloC family endoribonuclease [Clostridium drakei]AWI03934.1 YicC family protein [Clostridium drakei]
MIKSMTGFGRGSTDQEGGRFTVEIKTVNHRYLDLNIKMPKTFIALEDRMRKLIKEKVNRGKIDIFITQNNYEKQGVNAILNEPLADSYVQCLNKIRERYGMQENITVSLIAKFPEVITIKQEEEDLEILWESLRTPLEDAVDMLVSMREKEGTKLQQNIFVKCDYIKSLLDKIEKRSPQVVVDYKQKLTTRLSELMQDYTIDESRIAMEIALFADKACLDEEIVRLNSHLIQMKDTLNLEEPIGRKLDFIVQEMNREANTIASKSNDLEITNHVLNIKNEIEKIREQIQNIE